MAKWQNDEMTFLCWDLLALSTDLANDARHFVRHAIESISKKV